MDNRSREEYIAWLTQIIDNELKKPDDQMDMDLILECSDYLDELQKEKNFYNERDIQTKIDIIKRRVENSTKNEGPARIIRTKRRVPLYKKVLVAIAAALLLVVSALTVVARVQNYNSVLEFLKEHIGQIKRMSANETLDDSGISVSKTENTVWYDSIEELVASENISILAPQNTSKEYSINSIHKGNIAVTNTLSLYCLEMTKSKY